MTNPFEELEKKLSIIESKIDRLTEKIEKPENNEPTWLTTKQLAQYLSLSTSAVTNMRGGKLPFYKLGGRIYFKKQEIDEWIEKTRYKAGADYLNEYLRIR